MSIVTHQTWMALRLKLGHCRNSYTLGFVYAGLETRNMQLSKERLLRPVSISVQTVEVWLGLGTKTSWFGLK